MGVKLPESDIWLFAADSDDGCERTRMSDKTKIEMQSVDIKKFVRFYTRINSYSRRTNRDQAYFDRSEVDRIGQGNPRY